MHLSTPCSVTVPLLSNASPCFCSFAVAGLVIKPTASSNNRTHPSFGILMIFPSTDTYGILCSEFRNRKNGCQCAGKDPPVRPATPTHAFATLILVKGLLQVPVRLTLRAGFRQGQDGYHRRIRQAIAPTSCCSRRRRRRLQQLVGAIACLILRW